jgi:hypothetical protein
MPGTKFKDPAATKPTFIDLATTSNIAIRPW